MNVSELISKLQEMQSFIGPNTPVRVDGMTMDRDIETVVEHCDREEARLLIVIAGTAEGME